MSNDKSPLPLRQRLERARVLKVPKPSREREPLRETDNQTTMHHRRNGGRARESPQGGYAADYEGRMPVPTVAVARGSATAGGPRRPRRGRTLPPHIQALVNTGATLPTTADVSVGLHVKIRSQGSRGNCVGHAVTTCHEILKHPAHFLVDDIFDPAWDDDSLRTVGDRFSGAVVQDVVALVESSGQRQLTSRGKPIPNSFETQKFVKIEHGNVQAAKLRLLSGSPLAVALDRLGAPDDTRSGEISLATYKDDEDGGFTGHGIAIVGYTDADDESENGTFKFVNSWGTSWGNGGFGTVTYDYYKAYCNEAYAAAI